MEVEDLAAHGVNAEVIGLLKKRYDRLTPIQDLAIGAGVLAGKNIVVSAPTSAGKTLIGELVAARHAGHGLTVYLVSHKALANQIHGILSTRYIRDGTPYLKAGLLTGDQDTIRGEWSQFDVAVATFEKFYAALLSRSASLSRLRAVVADEIQLVADEERGPTVELLIARLRLRRPPPQIVALSATVPNGRLLAEWLDAAYVERTERLPPLEHEIWMPGRRLVFTSSESDPREERLSVDPIEIGPVVCHLIEQRLGPVAVMATERRYAREDAAAIAELRPVKEDFPPSVIDEFRSMSRDPDGAATSAVCALLLRGVGVHHADLMAEQRLVIEDAFSAGHLDVIVATPTLVAGVNLPIRTVVYPRLTRYAGDGDRMIRRAEYTNGAGRAGRQGLHDRGTSILLARSGAEASVFSQFVREQSEHIASRLGERSRGFRVLHLLADSGAVPVSELARKASLTLMAREAGRSSDAESVQRIETELAETIDDPQWAQLWTRMAAGAVRITPIGLAIAATGLDPAVALEAYDELKRYDRLIRDGRDAAAANRDLLARLCCCQGTSGHLPYQGRGTVQLADDLVEIEDLIPAAVRTPARVVGLANALLAIGDAIVSGEHAAVMHHNLQVRSRIAGQLSRLILAACALADADDAGGFERAVFDLKVLADRLEFHVAEDAIPVERLFAQNRVRNVGPKKRAKLAAIVQGEPARILKLPDDQLKAAVGLRQVSDVRAAVLDFYRGLVCEQSRRQLEESKRDASLQALVEGLLRKSGTGFNAAVREALRTLGWNVELVSEDRPGSKADIEGSADAVSPVIVECKTTEDLADEVSRKEAFEIRSRVPPGFDGLVLTVGRPVFSPAAIEHAVRATDLPLVRLVTAGALAEFLIRSHVDGVPRDFVVDVSRRFRHIDVARVRAEVRARRAAGL